MSHRVRARGPVDVDATAYGGNESAGYSSCAGRAGIGASYGGLGAQVRLHPSAAEGERNGVAITAGAAFQWERFSFLECEGGCAGFSPGRFPIERVLGGGYLRVGNDWRYFGVQAGVLVLPPMLSMPGELSWSLPVPDVYLRAGRLDTFYVDVGHHSPLMVFHPGIHVGLNYVPAPDWLLSLHGGYAFRFGIDAAGGRADFDLRTPVTDGVQVGLGGSVSDGLHRPGYEVRSLIALQL
jgi:hypothetical protein